MKISGTKKIDGISPRRATGIRGRTFKREHEAFTVVRIADNFHFNEKISFLKILAGPLNVYSHTGAVFQNLARVIGGGDQEKFAILHEKEEHKSFLDKIFTSKKVTDRENLEGILEIFEQKIKEEKLKNIVILVIDRKNVSQAPQTIIFFLDRGNKTLANIMGISSEEMQIRDSTRGHDDTFDEKRLLEK